MGPHSPRATTHTADRSGPQQQGNRQSPKPLGADHQESHSSDPAKGGSPGSAQRAGSLPQRVSCFDPQGFRVLSLNKTGCEQSTGPNARRRLATLSRYAAQDGTLGSAGLRDASFL